MDDQQVKIFISYSHTDDTWQEKINAELGLLDIEVWADREIKPGARWEDDIERELAAADIILLLISRDFLNSDFVKNNELPKALSRLKDGDDGARVVPVLLRETTWKKKFDLGAINAIPRNEKWLTKWDDEDEAITSVARDLAGILDDVKRDRAKRQEDAEGYRHRVAEMLADDDEISHYEKRTLEEHRQKLGLSEGLADEIEAGERRGVEARLDNLKAFEEDIEYAIQTVGRPFDDKTREELKKRKSKLELRDVDVAGLEDRVAERVEDELRVATARTEADQTRKAEEVRTAEATRKADEARIAKAVEAYRQSLATALSNGRISKAERQALDEQKKSLGISDVEAQDVEASEREARKANLAAERKERATEARKAQEATAEALTEALTPLVTDGLSVRSSIPEKKLRNARERSEIPMDETIVAVVDCTAFGSAKDHWAFTGKAMYCRVAGRSVKIPYDELKSISCDPDGKHAVRIGPDRMSLGGSVIGSTQAVEIIEAVKQQL